MATSPHGTSLEPDALTGALASSSDRRLRSCIGGLVLVATVLAIGTPLYVMAGDRARVVSFVSDDAYYYLNVAANIAQGHGPTADGITKTTGFHPLYGFLLAGVYRLTEPTVDGFVRLAIGVNTISLLLAGLFLYLAAEVWWGRFAGATAALLWLANPHAALVNVVGLEGSVYAMTLALLVWRLSVLTRPESAQPGPVAWTVQCVAVGVCAGLVLLSRTDALLFIAMVVPVVLSARGWRSLAAGVWGALLVAVVSVGLLGVWWWYARMYTGAAVQGSAAIKMLWRPELVEAEFGRYSIWTSLAFGSGVWFGYVAKCVFKVPVLKWLLAALPGQFTNEAGPRRLLLHSYWLFPVGLGAAYAMLIDRPRTWYYVPAILMLTFIAAGAAARLVRETATNPLFALAKRWLPVLGWLVVVECAAVGGRNIVHGRSSDQVNGLRGAEWVSSHIEPSALIGCWHSGIVQYYTPDHTVINLDGLANNEILAVMRGEKTMNEYWDERGITVILGLPRQKMGGFAYQWDGKKLSPVREGVLRVVPVAEGGGPGD